MVPPVPPAPLHPRSHDRRLWLASVLVSLLFNLSLLSFTVLHPLLTPLPVTDPASSPDPEPDTLVITPEILRTSLTPTPQAQPPSIAPFTRTTGDQSSDRPVHPKYIGERNTTATSDATPDPNAIEVPAQSGIQPKDHELETTESNYQDGSLAHNRKTNPNPPAPDPRESSRPNPPAPTQPPTHTASSLPEPPPRESDPRKASRAETTPPPTPQPAPADSSADSPAPDSTPPAKRNPSNPDELPTSANQVDVPIPQARKPPPKPTPEDSPPAPPPNPAKSNDPQHPAPTQPDPREAGFRGNQRKTTLVGSITRTGHSALDVANSPLGRYQAALSRAIESEWQQNCIRRRDFITPGFQTIRFTVGPDGKVRTVQFLETVGGSEIQKGISLNAIRQAPIPPMPDAVRSELGNQPMELVYRFYF